MQAAVMAVQQIATVLVKKLVAASVLAEFAAQNTVVLRA